MVSSPTLSDLETMPWPLHSTYSLKYQAMTPSHEWLKSNLTGGGNEMRMYS